MLTIAAFASAASASLPSSSSSVSLAQQQRRILDGARHVDRLSCVCNRLGRLIAVPLRLCPGDQRQGLVLPTMGAAALLDAQARYVDGSVPVTPGEGQFGAHQAQAELPQPAVPSRILAGRLDGL